MGAGMEYPGLRAIRIGDATGDGIVKAVAEKAPAIDEGARSIDFIVSTAARDRDGDIVMPEGWELSRYRENPVVLWGHNPMQPIGRSLAVRVENGALMARAEFMPRETSELADSVFKMYAGGFLKAVSAGFMPLEMEPMQHEDGGRGFMIRRQELWEFSCVAIPSNPEALVMARSKGLDITPAREWLERALDENMARQYRDEMSQAYIRLTGELHPVHQAEIAARNFGPKDEEKAPAGTPATTGQEEGHSHGFEVGATQTEPAGDPEHVHALTVDEDDGSIVVEDAEGHGHEVAASVDDPEDDEAVQIAANAPKVWSLSASEVAALKADFPALGWMGDVQFTTREALESWRDRMADEKAGGVITITGGKPDTVTLTEDMAAKLADVVSMVVKAEFRRAAGRV